MRFSCGLIWADMLGKLLAQAFLGVGDLFQQYERNLELAPALRAHRYSWNGAEPFRNAEGTCHFRQVKV